MNASSQTSPGAMPQESPRGPQPSAAPATPAGMFAAYGAVVPVPLGSTAAAPQADITPTTDAPGDQAAPDGQETAGQPLDAKAIADRAYQLGVDDTRAEYTRADQDEETVAWFHGRLMTVAALCAGRRPEDLLTVHEVLTAADGRQPTDAPLTIAWDGTVRGLVGDTPHEDTVVPCTTVRGGPAALVLDDQQRLMLGELLLATVHTAATCSTPGCGMADEDLDPSDPVVPGSVLVQVSGTDEPARWWCSVWCANSAITAAGAELAAADQAAAVDPDAQAPLTALPVGTVVLHRFEPETLGESDAKRRAARCRHCTGSRTDAVHTWADDDQAAVGGGL
ncbi:hypothetical protein [Streptomyces sp. AK08-02]|uniref:hypothetical protein n=1 Tax=Streptomyces sp. AK08-02 TaxID=3028654 RepID=UPI0029AE6F8C|nr:hypothetical protein [Streptomyces sp. AK08-02]MDX3748695.1 hypothetical protein [Streptomyces sp. AK08-02]